MLGAWQRDKSVLRAAAGSKPPPPLEWRDEWQARDGGGRGDARASEGEKEGGFRKERGSDARAMEKGARGKGNEGARQTEGQEGVDGAGATRRASAQTDTAEVNRHCETHTD